MPTETPDQPRRSAASAGSLILAALLAGCATCTSSQWAQTGPAVEPVREGPPVHMGVLDPALAPVEPWTSPDGDVMTLP